jgi:hypothetical protein
MQRTLRNRVLGAATAIAVVTTLASSALIANAQTTDGGTTGDGGADEVGRRPWRTRRSPTASGRPMSATVNSSAPATTRT